LQRTLCFTRYLPRYGWDPVVLSATPGAYPEIRDDQLADIPSYVPVKRALAFDASKHLSILGRYPGWMALPDRWVSWYISGILSGLRLIRQYKPDVLWSTYPIATAHMIGYGLHRWTGIPWVAEFRDPMTEVDPETNRHWPEDAQLWRVRRWIERRTVLNCSRAVLVAPGALQIYAERYPQLQASHWALIGNGYDELAFAAAEQIAQKSQRKNKQLVLLHSGFLYPTTDRDPSAFFNALGQLRTNGKISSTKLEVVLRDSGYDDIYKTLIVCNGIEDIVNLKPSLPYRDALAEMLISDGLLLFQGKTSNSAIPAKLYEYLRARRPILALVDSKGDTASVLRSLRMGKVVPLDSSEEIAKGLQEFLEEVESGTAPKPNNSEVTLHSREQRTRELARILDELAG
jgi:glycosyl transferase family 4